MNTKIMKSLCAGLVYCGTAAVLTACTGDYTDWATPFKTEPEAAKTVSMTVSPAAAVDFATFTDEKVQIFVPTVTVDDESENAFSAVLAGSEEGDNAVFETDANGYVATADLETAVNALYGQRPVARQIPVTVTGLIKVGGQTFKSTASTTLTCTPNAPDIEAAYYLTGTLNGWDNTDKTYVLTNGGDDPYENPVYTCRIPAPEDGSNVEFKMTPESGIGGDWSKCLAAGDEGKFNYGNVGGNFVIQAVDGAKFYDLTFDMMEQTWTSNAIKFNNYIYEAGVNNDWGAVEQPLYCANQDGIYRGFFYAADADWSGGKGAFKFTGVFNSWDNGNYGPGTMSDDGLTGTLIDDGGSGNIFVEPGFYRADVNLADMTYSLTPIAGIGIIGPAQPGGWDTDTDMAYNPETRAWEATIELAADELKFRANDDWAINWGGTADALTQDGGNLRISEAGTYFIQLFPLCETKAHCTITKQ